MKRIGLLLLFVLTLIVAESPTAFGQATASGAIQGTVLDHSQAAIVGAQVEATNKATGIVRSLTTTDAGYFRFDLLAAGSYVVKITKPGFTSWSQATDLLVGQTATMNAELKIGAASEIIEVTSAVPLVDVAKTEVSQNITPTEVQELPMIGRDVANLASLAPGVKLTDSYDPTKNRYAILSVNGQGGRNVNVTVNGVDNKDNTVGGPVMQLPGEAVEEFKVSTQRFSAANGRSEGAAINMITKSGSNTLHGSFFGQFRSEALNAHNYFEKAENGGSGDKSPYSRQVFGGSLGAPIIKDKLFGFFALERQREHTSLTESSTAFNELSLAVPIGAQPAQVIPTPFFETRYNGRLDYKFNDRHTAYLSYSSQENNSNNDQSDGLGDLTGGNFTKNHLQVANLTVNSVLTPTWVNSFTFGYQFWNNIIDSNIVTPYVTFNAVSEWFGTNVNVPQESYQRKFQFRDDITKSLRNHTLKFGIDYIYNPKLGGFFKSNSTLEVDFTDDPSTILSNATTYPQGFATPGAVNAMSASSGNPYFDMPGGTKQLGLYFQDDWKVNRKLSLNLGIRWDKDYNLVGASAIANSRTYLALQAIGSPYAKLPHDDNKDFSPRIGFAYDPLGTGRHVIRGGFGLYYGNIFQNIPLFMIQQANDTIYQGVFSIASPSDIVPGTGKTLGQWAFGVDPFPTIPGPTGRLADGSTGRLMDPDYRNPVTEEFNLGYQWAVTNNAVVEVEYVHVLGLHENKTVNINPTLITGIDYPDPSDPDGTIVVNTARPLSSAFAAAKCDANGAPDPNGTSCPILGRVMDEQSVNRSRYDGLNFSYRQRMTRHFSLNANYTLSWARGWDVAANGSSFRNYPHDPLDLWNPLDFGYTPNDQRHHIAVSGIFELPWGFQVSPILVFGTEAPYDLTSSYDVLLRGSGYTRPNIVSNDDPTNYNAFDLPSAVLNNTPAFTVYGTQNGNPKTMEGILARECLAVGQCREVGYDTVRGDNFFQMDLRAAKNFRFKERFNVQLFFQAFNLTNRANFGNNFFNTPTSGSFMTKAGFVNPSSTMIPRAFNGEFGFRFSF
jgi:outer membrane receptor protein involved in Fe transport